jgi:hypothetical protein
MRTFLASFLIVGFGLSYGYAECAYFRVSTDLLKCKVADAKELDHANPYQASQDLPELEGENERTLIAATCDCSYSLMGADPRCDMEESMEKSSVIGVQETKAACRRGRELCKEICPPRLP